MLRKILRELKDSGAMQTIFGVILLAFLFLILLTHLCSCSGLSLIKTTTENMPQDTFVEEAIEDVIMNATGVEIDFSGSTPED